MRPTTDEVMLAMAIIASTRGTCSRRRVGCVLTDSRHHVLATGYNGVPAGDEHCTDSPCKGASYPSGHGLEFCEALHAEENALLQCKDTQRIHTCYTISSPCRRCAKLLRNTSCKRIVFIEEYPHPEARDLWLSVPHNEWFRHPDVRVSGAFESVFGGKP